MGSPDCDCFSLLMEVHLAVLSARSCGLISDTDAHSLLHDSIHWILVAVLAKAIIFLPLSTAELCGGGMAGVNAAFSEFLMGTRPSHSQEQLQQLPEMLMALLNILLQEMQDIDTLMVAWKVCLGRALTAMAGPASESD